MGDRHCEAVLHEVLRALLTHVRVEVASDDDRCIASLLADDVQHVLRAGVPLVRIAGLAIAAVDAPMCVEVPEGAAAGRVSQLRPCDIPWPPLTCCPNIPGSAVAHG